MKPLYLYIISTVLIISCNPDEGNFYKDNGGLDFGRIPLIYPYEIMQTSSPYWYIVGEYSGENSRLIIGDIDSFDIVDSLIIGSELKKYSVKEVKTWYIIIPTLKKEMKFKSDSAFYVTYTKYSDKKIHLKDCEDIWKKFKDEKFLEWFPEDYENHKKYRLKNK